MSMNSGGSAILTANGEHEAHILYQIYLGISILAECAKAIIMIVPWVHHIACYN